MHLTDTRHNKLHVAAYVLVINALVFLFAFLRYLVHHGTIGTLGLKFPVYDMLDTILTIFVVSVIFYRLAYRIFTKAPSVETSGFITSVAALSMLSIVLLMMLSFALSAIYNMANPEIFAESACGFLLGIFLGYGKLTLKVMDLMNQAIAELHKAKKGLPDKRKENHH